MKKNIKILKKELENLQKKNSSSINLQNTSIFLIIKYKYQLYRQKKIEYQIEKLNLKMQKVENKFNSQIDNWLQSLKINCRQYYRLESKAHYKKDKILYKFGYISKKPLSPIAKKLIKSFSPISYLLKSIISCIPFYKLNPKKQFTKFAINSTKRCIRNYRHLKQIKLSAKKSILKTSLMKKIIDIKNEALNQLNEESISNQNMTKDNNSEFLNNIKVNIAPILNSNQLNFNNNCYHKSIPEDHIL